MTEQLMQKMAVGMIVRSADGERLGKVVALGPATFQIEKGFFFPKEFTTTYDEVTAIRGGEIILSHGRDALLADVKGTEIIEEKAEDLLAKAKGAVVHAGERLHEAVAQVAAPPPTQAQAEAQAAAQAQVEEREGSDKAP